MLPIGDKDNRPQSSPVIVIGLIGINTVIFIFELFLMRNESSFVNFLNVFGFVPQKWYHIWTSVTSTFIHGGLLHLAGNMFFLWIFGDNIEDLIGKNNFIVFYVLCGACACIVDGLFRWNSPIPAIGASGAISGILGAYMRYFPKNKIIGFVYFFKVELEAVWYLGFWFTGQLFYSLALAGADFGIAFGAHIGGFIAGYFLIKLFPVNQEVVEYYKENAKKWW